jgi:hypothetical protein
MINASPLDGSARAVSDAKHADGVSTDCLQNAKHPAPAAVKEPADFTAERDGIFLRNRKPLGVLG